MAITKTIGKKISIILDMPETFTEYGHILNEIKDVILLGREN